jgi:cadmium resistance protein CadD (predicted permease)
MLAELGTAIVVFVATNVDDILLLAALFGGALKARAVVAGQFIGIAVLTAVSAGAARAAAVVPPRWIDWLGLLPIAIGLWLLVQLWRKRGRNDDDGDDDHDADVAAERRLESRLHSQVLGVTAITIANGGDNLSVYIPLFADDPSIVPLYAAVFLVLTAAWCWLGYALVKNPTGGALMERWGHIVLPVVLIAIGIRILLPGNI